MVLDVIRERLCSTPVWLGVVVTGLHLFIAFSSVWAQSVDVTPPKPSNPQLLTAGSVFRDRLKTGGEGPEMVKVPAGKFQMGDIDGRGDKNERPVHEVIIQKPFAIGRYEVTFEEYDQFAADTQRELPDDDGWGRGRRPVIRVFWADARAYAEWLSKQTGKRYRLPTEAEWEYAARSGGKHETWAGTSNEDELGEYGWYHTNSGDQTHPVGEKKPNGLGLYDMSGNVLEWTSSLHKAYPYKADDGRENPKVDDTRVVRGGSSFFFFGTSAALRTSTRGYSSPDLSGAFLGFRLARDIE